MMQPRLDELEVTPEISITTLKDFCSWALEKWKDAPDQAALREKALCSAREAAEIIAGLAKARRSDADRDMALELVRLFRDSGIHNGGVSAQDLARGEALRGQGWSGILASMLLVPAWGFARPLSYDAVPRWLWNDYTRYLFAVPSKTWTKSLSNAYAANMRHSLEMLAQLSRANRGSSAVQAARKAYFEQDGSHVLATASCALSDCIAQRAKLTNLDAKTAAGGEPPVAERHGRALRLGVCLPNLSDTSAARSLLALVKHLPEDRFNVHYFVLEYTYGQMEERLRAASANITLMDANYPQQSLEMAALDAALLLIDPFEGNSPLAKLGHIRFAPLQIATNLRGTPTGLPEIDLFLGLEKSAAATNAERLGVLPLPSMVVDVDTPVGAPSAACSRDALGIPHSARVLVSMVEYRTVSLEMIEAWAEILRGSPQAHLLLHLFSENAQDDDAVHALCRDIDQELVFRGIPTERLTILGARQTSLEDWVGLMRISDVYLDSYPCSTPLSVAAALTAGTPAVCRTGDEPRMRTGAAMLEAENLGRYVAVDSAHCVELVAGLLGSTEDCGQLRDSLGNASDRGMVLHDSLAASDAFGGLVGSAFDEIARTSTQLFKSEAAPFSTQGSSSEASSLEDVERAVAAGMDEAALGQLEQVLAVQPLKLEVRRIMGQVLARLGQHKRAVEYQRAVLRKSPRDARGWFELSRSLFRGENVAETCSALHQSIKLDPGQPDPWFFMGELTINAKDVAGARSIVEVLRKLAPDDERLADLERLANELPSGQATGMGEMPEAVSLEETLSTH